MPRKILLHSLLICLCLADPARAQGKPSDAVRQITAQQQQKPKSQTAPGHDGKPESAKEALRVQKEAEEKAAKPTTE